MKTIELLFGSKHSTLKRVPVDYLASSRLDRKLREHLGVEDESGLLDRLGVDFFYLPGRDISQNEGINPYYRGALEQSETERTCPLRIRWHRKSFSSKFDVDEAIQGPFDDQTSIRDILDFPWPRAEDFDFSPLVEKAVQNENRILVGGLWSGIFGDSYRMLGFERFLNDMAANPERIQTLVDRVTDMYLELNEHYFSQLAGRLDIWFFGNDFGSQRGLLFSPKMWDRFFAENIRRLVASAHRHGIAVMMHSCGSIVPLIGRLVDLGVDILDPVQTSAVGMEPAALQEKFGGRIVFHGGIDTQHLLVKGTLDEVRQHVTSILETFSETSSYIFAPSQIFQSDIPLDNILAAYETVAEYNRA